MNINEIRREINGVNDEILAAFDRRMQLAAQVAQYKKENNMDIFDKPREEEILADVAKNANPQYSAETVEMFKTLMTISKNYQYKKIGGQSAGYVVCESLNVDKLAYAGVEGCYAYQAAKRSFSQVQMVSVNSFEDVFAALESGTCDFGIVPIENSSSGSLFDVYGMLMDYGHYIAAETFLKIDHNLMAKPGTKIENITKIYSHPQAFLQCEGYLRQMGDVQQIPCYNTAAGAFDIARSGELGCAAIASSYAARLYGLEILAEHINDNPDNYTRFAVITKDFLISNKASHVSIAFSLSHESGSLYHTLSIFACNNLNLVKIQSRPYPSSKFKYWFFAEFEGRLTAPGMDNALEFLRKETENFIIFGNYEQHEI